MWESLARWVLRWKYLLLGLLVLLTAFFGWHASQVRLSYDFAKAIPLDNPKYLAYQSFKRTFGEDGNLMVIGVQTDRLFQTGFFNDYSTLVKDLKKIKGVEDVLGVPVATNLAKDTLTEKLQPRGIFSSEVLSQQQLDSSRDVFLNLPFYSNLLYNPSTNASLLAIRINKDLLNSAARTGVVASIAKTADAFAERQNVKLHYSGLPLIRTRLADRIAAEMQWFLLGSLLLSALILLVFFRSVGTVLLSLGVVITGVIWSVGTMHLFGYSITLLNALIPPLVVVIGIPNCIYFLNKYHTAYNESKNREQALIAMISRMGVVTLFCNLTAAIGFAVFALTKSAILKEFGIVAGINIFLLFIISLVLIPAVLSMQPPPKARHTRYLENRWLLAVMDRLEIWSLNHQKLIYGVTGLVLIVAIAGLFRLRSEGFIVDDLPKSDPISTDLKFFETHFGGVMPLEVLIDTKKRNGLRSNPLQTFGKIDSFSNYLFAQQVIGKPLSIVEGLKFARQAYYDGDSTNYGLPNSFDISFLLPYLGSRKDSLAENNNFSRLLNSFMDSSRQQARISMNMADVGSKRLPEILALAQTKAEQLFDSTHYRVEFTGTSVTFLEGTSYIINGLTESIAWAFLFIALSMIYLFRSLKILICSLIPNLIPLIITAGVMGWAGVALKPSTVLIFSIALGIAIDITIRFLVSYKQELALSTASPKEIVIQTIHKTGISILYTSLVLIAGFIIFCFSGFGGTQSLGWLTSLTLVLATLTNLIFLPALLLSILKK
ncbi:MAG TPA: MMPL family transporter [Chitinophagaceae bacterium]